MDTIKWNVFWLTITLLNHIQQQLNLLFLWQLENMQKN